MKFKSKKIIVKLSVSDVLQSQKFYEEILGFKTDEKYTLNSGGNYGTDSFIQLYLEDTIGFMLGLYKDITTSFDPLPQTGTAPTFMVDDIEATLDYFQKEKVVIDEIEGEIIISNTSDQGYTDRFFFFRDPDNNSLVVRQDT
jgi:catechol 2,3-dioxygenase-like lactoylglutathione lyase family enzyme